MQARLLQHIKYRGHDLDLWKTRLNKWEVIQTDNKDCVYVYEFKTQQEAEEFFSSNQRILAI